jgi:hydroxypyruvate isomerase
MTRRTFVPALAGAGALATAFGQDTKPAVRKGKLKQGVTGGVFGKGMSFEDQCRHASRLGVQGFDLKGPADWPVMKKYGLVPSMVPGGGGTIPDALNRVENHDRIETAMRETIDICAKAGAPNLITFSGNRRGQPDEQGIENCVKFLNKVKAQAEDKGVTICMEYLNSKVNHKDYQFDHTAYGVEVCKRVNSPRVKLLFDMYHVQIMEGDIIRTLRENIQYIAHFHTAGNPGRHEMDDTQEMNYRGIVRSIADLNFTGFVSHEYSPLRDPLKSLEETLDMFDVT